MKTVIKILGCTLLLQSGVASVAVTVEADRESAARFLFRNGTTQDKDIASPLLDARATAEEERFLKRVSGNPLLDARAAVEEKYSSLRASEKREPIYWDIREAFDKGDTETLESLKTGIGANLNDLGGWFSKYGHGLSCWDYLIKDALKNKK